MPDIAFAHVHGHGAIEQNVDSESTRTTARNLSDIRCISSPHRAVLRNDLHDHLTFVH
jgi:hypothetical protein